MFSEKAVSPSVKAEGKYVRLADDDPVVRNAFEANAETQATLPPVVGAVDPLYAKRLSPEAFREKFAPVTSEIPVVVAPTAHLEPVVRVAS